ncbi:RNA degradosome polyphosphate kinase [Alicyclobacillus sp. SO9]|uniref:RNA degradosome polyphosphate kinase n=1 Tax=Alicyclobacillus sp. SO9 TaxID=2665646 RepID=UPI0018E876A2|nr:RNA degradosome polyphosphate kinase [Alicyclobacillus sp. SO9]QQE80093.1 RNA degradosome polyphosphate kinase [Alicyclobacillus sp. SO9]
MKDFSDKSNYINRELSWLAFNERVLDQAANPNNPILERLRFISITASNLDEFFMVRVAGLKDQVKVGYNVPDNKTKMTAEQQLSEISKRVHKHFTRLYSTLTNRILPALANSGIQFLSSQELSSTQREFLLDYFHHDIFPVLTPLGIDASHPFPMLANRTLNLAVLLKPRDTIGDKKENLFAVVQVPSVLPRFIKLPSKADDNQYVLLESVIQNFIETLFPGNQVLESGAFRITRNADITFDEESAEDLLEEIERELKNRKKGAAVRLEVESGMSQALSEPLRIWSDLRKEDVYSVHGPLDTKFYSKIYDLPGYDYLRYDTIMPQRPRDLVGESNIFEAIKHKDILMMHPYESFEPVIHFVNQAADDPNVLAIKQTLYRVSGNSPVVNALARAAENGKQVTVLVELKARFDEANNIVWAKKLEEAGCHVIYGLVGLKTHSKITLVVRREETTIQRYVHLSTGNYNDITARAYTDIGMCTARNNFGYDASEFFNHLTGFGTTPEWRMISIAPRGMKTKFIELIENEIETSTPDNPGRIIAKMNSLTDKDLIRTLYHASCNGIQIDLIVRGISCLRPGIPGVSENINVSSIVGRFLEHSRIFYFKNGGNEQVYLSSADWMTRNMIKRVEILFPVVQDNLKERLKSILQVYLSDNTHRYVLHADESYEKVVPQENEICVNSQLYFHEEAVEAATLSDGVVHKMTPIVAPKER